MSLADKLREMRDGKGWSQQYVGNKLNISRSAISKLETGKQTPSIEILKQYAKLFHIDPQDLISELTGGTISKEERPAYRYKKSDEERALEELYKRNPKLKRTLLELEKYPAKEQQRTAEFLETFVKGLRKS
ncbi:helix-turn-helix domain-containing protein [Peribacillus sp. SCS-155]|uniref:helix-turn-helix domain-containing protein n=1 Tax=Peribacillus sedimenti TaxID=3115297 RepID=UPI003905CD82